jgi:hypothetical protein
MTFQGPLDQQSASHRANKPTSHRRCMFPTLHLRSYMYWTVQSTGQSRQSVEHLTDTWPLCRLPGKYQAQRMRGPLGRIHTPWESANLVYPFLPRAPRGFSEESDTSRRRVSTRIAMPTGSALAIHRSPLRLHRPRQDINAAFPKDSV